MHLQRGKEEQIFRYNLSHERINTSFYGQQQQR